jgi:hypothetical protein
MMKRCLRIIVTLVLWLILLPPLLAFAAFVAAFEWLYEDDDYNDWA